MANFVAKAPQMNPMTQDIQAQMLALERNRQIADELRKQAVIPIGETQYISGSGPTRAVPNSPLAALAKLGSAGLGMYLQKQNDAKQVELTSAQNKRMAELIRGMAPAGTFDDNQPMPTPQADSGAIANGQPPPTAQAYPVPTGGAMSDAPMQPQPSAQNVNPAMISALRGNSAPAQPQVPDIIKRQWQQAISAYPINPELAIAMMKNASELTPEQKNQAAKGQDPRLMGQLEIAEARKKGIMEYQPGTTSQDFATGETRFQPKYGEGMQPDGRGGAMAAPGYANANAGIVGAAAQATEAAKAGLDMVTVDTKQGPVLMTRAQAKDWAAANQGQNGPVKFTGSNGVSLNLQGMTPQQIFDQAQRSNDPDFKKAVREWMQSGGAQAGAMPPGIPLRTDVQKEREVGAVRVQNAVDEALTKSLPQERKDRQIALTKGGAAISLIEKALAHPGMRTATGLQGTIDPRNYIPGTNAKDFQVVMDQIKGQTFLQAMESLRGTGQITEIEGTKATDAIARLNRSQSTEEFQQALKDFKDVIGVGMQRIRGNKDDIDVARDKLGAPRSQSLPTNSPPQGNVDISGFKVIR